MILFRVFFVAVRVPIVFSQCLLQGQERFGHQHVDLLHNGGFLRCIGQETHDPGSILWRNSMRRRHQEAECAVSLLSS